mmetsp:Transcript_5060/g.17567  ORF Transcript_5060/g.17567 Transcript_5060/m.17567 type:complete len:225 (+) Transcript_5060:2357-3031(+)
MHHEIFVDTFIIISSLDRRSYHHASKYPISPMDDQIVHVISLILLSCGCCCTVVQESFDEGVEPCAREDAFDVGRLLRRAHILCELVRMEDVVADLAAPLRLDDVAANLANLRCALVLRNGEQLRLQELEPLLFVERLRTLLRALDSDARGDVLDPHRRLHFVDVLPPFPAGAHRRNLEVVLRDGDVRNVFGEQRHHLHRGKRRLASPARVEGRHAHQTVRAVL